MAAVALEREEYRAQRNRVEEQRSWFVKILRELQHQQRGVKTRFELLTLPITGGGGDSTDMVQIQAAFFVKVCIIITTDSICFLIQQIYQWYQ